MKRFALAAVVLGVTLSASRSQAQNTGIDLQRDCKPVLAANMTAAESVNAAHCLGYISGAAFSITMWQATNKDRHFGLDTVPACLPDKGTSEEYVKVVLHYLDENPNKLHLSYGLLVFLAFRDAYPCTAK